jgi:hypothetical protein
MKYSAVPRQKLHQSKGNGNRPEENQHKKYNNNNYYYYHFLASSAIVSGLLVSSLVFLATHQKVLGSHFSYGETKFLKSGATGPGHFVTHFCLTPKLMFFFPICQMHCGSQIFLFCLTSKTNCICLRIKN